MEMKDELNAIQEAVETASEEDVELKAEDLDQVAGGREPIPVTKMRCSACGVKALWKGDFRGSTFDCPSCGKYAFESIGILWG